MASLIEAARRASDSAPRKALRQETGMRLGMRLGRLTILACPLSLAASAAAAAPATTSGSVALALAGVVAPYSPLPAAEKAAVAAFFNGDSNVPATKKITVTVD